MPWYDWLIIGVLIGFCTSVAGVAGFSFTIIRKPALMQWFTRRMMRTMISGSVPKSKEAAAREIRDDKHADTGSNVGSPLLALLSNRR